MRILYLAQLLPWPIDAGPKLRIFHVLQHLAASGHQITLVAFRRPTDQAHHITQLEPLCQAIYTVPITRSRLRDAGHLLRSLVTGQPFLIARDHSQEMQTLLAHLLDQQTFDAIHADQLWMAQYALAANRHITHHASRTTILDQHNAVHLIPQRLAQSSPNRLTRALLTLESRKLAAYEAETCRQFDHVVWVTQEDEQAVARQAHSLLPTPWPKASRQGRSRRGRSRKATCGQRHSLLPSQHHIIPICVDPQTTPPIAQLANSRRVTFLGGMHWPPNREDILWFARHVWPRITSQAPDALLTIIGKDPPAELSALAGDAIEVTGYLPDPEPYLAETAAFIVPLHAGGGMRVKILDAWCWSLPVVSTPIGAEGIACANDGNLLLAADASTFANAVSCLLNEPPIAARLANAGRRTVEASYDWRKAYAAWDNIYSDDR